MKKIKYLTPQKEIIVIEDDEQQLQQQEEEETNNYDNFSNTNSCFQQQQFEPFKIENISQDIEGENNQELLVQLSNNFSSHLIIQSQQSEKNISNNVYFTRSQKKQNMMNKCIQNPEQNQQSFEFVQSIFDSDIINDQQIVASYSFLAEKLSIKNLKTLKTDSCLNDEVINAYLKLIKLEISDLNNKIKIMNTFFFLELQNLNNCKNEEKQWEKIKKISKNKTNNINIETDQIFIPINKDECHWIFVLIDCPQNQIVYYDSFQQTDKEVQQFLQPFKQLVHYLSASELDDLKNQQSSNIDKIVNIKLINGSFPEQINANDCGMFMLKGIHHLIKHGQIIFSQDDIQYYRYQTCFELVSGKLMT